MPEWHEVKTVFGMSFASKRLHDLAQGFNPGNHSKKQFALKGRETIPLTSE
jgi:hypothetical protein